MLKGPCWPRDPIMPQPQAPPNLEYINAIESVYTKLSQQDAEELRANIIRFLRGSHLPDQALAR